MKVLVTYPYQLNMLNHYVLDHSNAFGLSGGNFLSRTSLPEPIFSGEGGLNIQLFAPCILTGPNWHMHNLAMRSTI